MEDIIIALRVQADTKATLAELIHGLDAYPGVVGWISENLTDEQIAILKTFGITTENTPNPYEAAAFAALRVCFPDLEPDEEESA